MSIHIQTENSTEQVAFPVKNRFNNDNWNKKIETRKSYCGIIYNLISV